MTKLELDVVELGLNVLGLGWVAENCLRELSTGADNSIDMTIIETSHHLKIR